MDQNKEVLKKMAGQFINPKPISDADKKVIVERARSFDYYYRGFIKMNGYAWGFAAAVGLLVVGTRWLLSPKKHKVLISLFLYLLKF